MKRMKTASLLIASIMVFSVFFGCNRSTENTSSLASEPTLSAPETSQTPSKAPASSSSATTSSSGTSSAAESSPDDKATSLKNIVTSNKEFNKLFIKNPIDKAYLAEMEKASSNADMIKVNEKYTKLWQTEIDSGYKKLLAKAPDAKKKSYQNRQEKWVKNTPDELKEITEKAQSAGSMAQLEASGETMEYYRERAAAIYKNLYTHDPKFTYAYSAKK
ncbi:lysozyme inhibitor LprI family protein [Faecalispora anaeroviscerum]|uniref:lysozyme inhibitor LprI family protein n=1 Tax=Faecalispora anaeroviscerum TaxID=2991836 RepID=UPI0024B9FD91|nr:lysozyme inhibitor LprI family protein [Faecalispora anaeroviscerum]